MTFKHIHNLKVFILIHENHRAVSYISFHPWRDISAVWTGWNRLYHFSFRHQMFLFNTKFILKLTIHSIVVHYDKIHLKVSCMYICNFVSYWRPYKFNSSFYRSIAIVCVSLLVQSSLILQNRIFGHTTPKTCSSSPTAHENTCFWPCFFLIIHKTFC